MEWEGDGFGSENKISCKGLNKRTNDITKERYLDVLRTQVPGVGVNRGFRMRGDGMYTYQQIKNRFLISIPKEKSGE